MDDADVMRVAVIVIGLFAVAWHLLVPRSG